LDASYRDNMTTPTEVRIAGVPWPAYKLAALAVGVIVLVLVGLVTTSLGPAVVAASAAATVVWLGLGLFQASDR
jgi:hypothetical protein